MRKVPALQKTPIALMTAYALSADEKSAMMNGDGVDQIIPKPLPAFEELQKVLNQVIQNKRAGSQPA
jgi:CheY-like chemotaxis protein